MMTSTHRDLAHFMAYWQDEARIYERYGHYDWMASLVPGQRVLEIGCGPGVSASALLKAGKTVMTLEVEAECMEQAKNRPDVQQSMVSGRMHFTAGDVTNITEECLTTLKKFAPDSVVCWLMGTTEQRLGGGGDQKMVATYRDTLQRQVAQLASELAGCRYLHFVDRTAVPWQGKDIARDLALRLYSEKTLADLPWQVNLSNVLYRKLEGVTMNVSHAKRNPLLKSVTPALSSVLAVKF